MEQADPNSNADAFALAKALIFDSSKSGPATTIDAQRVNQTRELKGLLDIVKVLGDPTTLKT